MNVQGRSLSQSEEPVYLVQTEESNKNENEDDNKYWNAPQDPEEPFDSCKEIESAVFDRKVHKHCYG